MKRYRKGLLGCGVTAQSVIGEGDWIVTDDSFQEVKRDNYGNLLVPPHLFPVEELELILTSPGFPPTHPLIRRGKGKIIGELDYINYPGFQIWVTGTNGKTTTTEMIHHLFPESEMGGNIGVPLGRLDKNAPIWVVEVSSFQLHWTQQATPDILVILPITPDHLDWHGSMEAYIKAKLSPITRMDERGVVIYPADIEKYLPPNPKPFQIPYQSVEDLITFFRLSPPKFPPPFTLDEVLARGVRKILRWDDPGLEGFKIDPHKVEEFKDYRGRVWVDDSKATNLDAVHGALNRYQGRKIYLILGGVPKGQDFTPLFRRLARENVELFFIGKETDWLEKLGNKWRIPHHNVGTLERAVKEIDTLLTPEEVALLSPGCASFDQFRNYKERGEIFKRLVSQLGEE
ncbi:MAG: UDP-N-acetylmuramoyl-L-alanine--D-glutamate ligase [Epsilonproteobacteria bacterium]|nr:UDP-N-acetylmuramoyl-L-alanine--D-glutamate ligase [Campylobacterota bacterium]NPA89629.1 UDP-N-acetylmuramoyl-L-alanine--D-glutamate ligase [Campylobacterota bacterium]